MIKSDERWISVNDKLPQNGDKVIFGANDISDLQNRLHKPLVTSGWYMDGFLSDFSKTKLKATHWMPMPILLNGF